MKLVWTKAVEQPDPEPATSPALYRLSYAGSEDDGVGLLYIGEGVIAGLDERGVRYDGSYRVVGGRTRARLELSVTRPTRFVTGFVVAAGGTVRVAVDWPSDLNQGNPLPLEVMGQQVMVRLVKARDLPVKR